MDGYSVFMLYQCKCKVKFPIGKHTVIDIDYHTIMNCKRTVQHIINDSTQLLDPFQDTIER